MGTRDEHSHYARRERSRRLTAELPVCPACHARIDARGYGHGTILISALEYNAAVQGKIDSGVGVDDAIGSTHRECACPNDAFAMTRGEHAQ